MLAVICNHLLLGTPILNSARSGPVGPRGVVIDTSDQRAVGGRDDVLYALALSPVHIQRGADLGYRPAIAIPILGRRGFQNREIENRNHVPHLVLWHFLWVKVHPLRPVVRGHHPLPRLRRLPLPTLRRDEDVLGLVATFFP